MQRSIRKPKKNLFEQDQQNVITNEQQTKQTQKVTSNKMIGKMNQKYDAAKIEQNQMYINRVVKEQQIKQQNKQVQKKPKKKLAKNKKNLFDSDSAEQKQKAEQKIQDIKEQNKIIDSQNQKEEKIQTKKQLFNKSKPVTDIKINQNQKSVAKITKFSDDEEQQQRLQQQQNQSEEQDNEQLKRAQQIKSMINQQHKGPLDEKIKQISFTKLLEKAGGDKQKIKKLLYQSIPIGYKATCIFKRVQSGFSENYQLLMQDGDRAFIFCQNQRGCIGANYYISLTKQMDKNSISYLGKLRGNKTGSLYQLYDGGKQPQNNINRKLWRCSLARIEYETNILGMNGPRKLQAIIPNTQNNQMDTFKLAQDEDLSILQPPITMRFRNKQPRWNQRLKSYALNFGGKVKQASIKNFILVNEEVSVEQQFNATNTLIFGKIDQNSFSLQAVFPLSVYQAFGIVLSQFDFKLNCQ